MTLLLTLVKKRKLRWFGHVSRSSGLAKKILQGTVKGKRKRVQTAGRGPQEAEYAKSGQQSDCCQLENSAGPAVGEARWCPKVERAVVAGTQSDCCADKLRRACCRIGSIRCSTPESPQGRIAGKQSDSAPETRQASCQGKHKMFDAGKSAGPKFAGTQSDCCAENPAEPVVRGA